MVRFLIRSYFVRHYTSNIRASPAEKLRLVQKFPSLFVSQKSTSAIANEDSYTVSYLMNTCGFSFESALSASKYLHFDGPTKPDSVISMFKTYGFSPTHISNILTRNPNLFRLKPEENLLPRLQFLGSRGASVSDLAIILVKNPNILSRSFEKIVAPFYDYITDLVLSDKKAINVLKRTKDIFGYDLESHLVPNINILLDNGVPKCNIASIFYLCHQQFISDPDRFNRNVEQVKETGLRPSQFNFLVAVIVVCRLSRETWGRKIDVYKRCGWTEDEVLAAFKMYPWCMTKSEEKIMSTMDLVVNKMGWESSQIAKYPQVVAMSLESRITPRSRVIQFLLSEGLVEKNPTLRSAFNGTEEKFLQKYVNCFKEGPQLLKLYKEKLDLASRPDD